MKRENQLSEIRETQLWDVVIIGGGATGLGAAVDAISRGLRVLLLEAQDFAKGTSSRSTKLVHGGVRYLAQGNIGLVRSALHERGLLRQNAPHLVRDLGFVIPAFDWWSGPYYGVGLKLYDILAGRLGLGSTQLLSSESVSQHIPTLKTEGLRGGVLYFDGQFDDARLAITLLRTFLDMGGCALNYFPVTGLVKVGGRTAGVYAQDTDRQETFEIRAKCVINATGVFADSVRNMDGPEEPMLSPSQGVHLVLPKRFHPGNSALMVPKTDDGRVLFAVPWHDVVILGTTDTAVDAISYEPRPLEQEIEFLLKHARDYLSVAPDLSDALSWYVGLRPLVKGSGSTAALSRDHVIQTSKSGLLTIVGGKWTTYRKMGQEVINQALGIAEIPFIESHTENLHLHGYQESTDSNLSVYGSDAAALLELEGSTQPIHPQLPYVEAEVRWAVRFEMAQTVEDVLSRRTRALVQNARASLEAAPRVAQIMAEELGRNEIWQKQQVDAYATLAEHNIPKPV